VKESQASKLLILRPDEALRTDNEYTTDREQATVDRDGRHSCAKPCVDHGAETIPYETQRIAQMEDRAVINRQPRTVD
jgi:hypothetical protein